MHKSYQLLPKLRTSYPGSIHRPSCWPAGVRYGGLAVCCLLLITGIVKTVDFFSSRITHDEDGGQYFAANTNFEPVAAAVAALHSKAAQAAATTLQQRQKQPVSSDAIQQLQQGMDSVSVGVAAMTRTLRDGDSWYASSNTTMGPAVTHTTFLEANSDIKSTGEAMVRKPLIHGHMEKNAPTDMKHWMHNYTDTRLDTFLSWRINRTRRGVGAATADRYTCPAADHPPIPFPGCHVFVNHK